ncbi:MAG: MFS transporter [Anaerolineaceae bacterium]|jgi:fucose permease|nr:MAG: MFS transporter [Anaerolineaceae bacterium]
MRDNLSRSTVTLLTIGCFFAFFLFGLTDNLKGPTLPMMLAELNINYGTGGNIFFGQYVGFFIATLLTGILADRFGLKPVILLAGVCLALGVGGYSTFKTAALLSLSLFIIGLGLGAFELGPNAVIISLYKKQKGLYLNLMAVMHGLGSTIAPLFAGWLLSLNETWRVIYRWDLLMIGAFILFALFLRFPKPEEKTAFDFRNISRVAFKDAMPLYYLAIAFYVAAEIGISSWLVIYLQKIHAVSVSASAQALALFFAMLMLGRFIGGFIVHRFGYLRSILTASLFSIFTIAIGTFTSLYFLLPFTGFFFSIIFPTLTAAVSDTHHENVNTLLGLLFTFAGLGGLFGPWLVAWGSEFFGLQIGFAVNLIIVFMMFTFALILFRMDEKKRTVN